MKETPFGKLEIKSLKCKFPGSLKMVAEKIHLVNDALIRIT